MALAVESVASMNGGQVAVEGTEVRASVALPIAGLMSDGKAPDVARAVEKLNKAAGSLGCGLEDPFMTTSFLALPVIPELKLTDKGLVDVGQFQVVPLYI
jgi:adenine deaminase